MGAMKKLDVYNKEQHDYIMLVVNSVLQAASAVEDMHSKRLIVSLMIEVHGREVAELVRERIVHLSKVRLQSTGNAVIGRSSR
jgi:hypothetical protein